MGCGGSNANYDPLVMTESHFVMERVVGEGGFGKVNAATRTSTNEWFAVKKLSKIPVLASKQVGMIFNERDLLASLNDHPFMVNMYYAFQDPCYCYLVLDLQLGGDLRFHLKTKYNNEQARFYVACIAIAVSFDLSQRICIS